MVKEKTHRGLYFKDIKVFSKWYLKKNKNLAITIDQILENPVYLEKMKSEMEKENTKRKTNAATKINNVGPNGNSKGGVTSGNNNVKSGHWASLKTKEHQSSSGKKSGDKNVETGSWQKTIEAGLQWHEENPQCRIDNAAKMNKVIKENGTRDKINKSLANRIFIMSDGMLIRNGFAKSAYIKKTSTKVVNIIDVSDNNYLEYENKMLKQKHDFICSILKDLPKEKFKVTSFKEKVHELGFSAITIWNYCKSNNLVEKVSFKYFKKLTK